MGSEGDLNDDIKKLIRMLKKIMKNHPMTEKMPDWEKHLSSSDFNVNVFIFPLLSLTPEEMEELEEIYEANLFDAEKFSEDLAYRLNQSDLEFLRRHGIRF